ncbi:hypothetical protein [Streptomyces sp. NPDC097619]|uniref:hypothetical protein n=1 Tax=Streptomyces sp. NPDC097619 TaxID=3157228 RepID=UPI0033313431
MSAPNPDAEALTTDLQAGPGGVMTEEEGVITGDVTVRTEATDDGHARVRVQYTGAEEWYTLTGSPTPFPATGLADLHARVLAAVAVGGAAEVPQT